MKGLTVTFECQLCGKKVEKVTIYEVGSKIQLPPGWAARDRTAVIERAAKLYPGWAGTQGPDILPRLFCSDSHMSAYSTVEESAAVVAHRDALELAQQHFEKLLRPAKLKAMDAVTALATAVPDEDEDEYEDDE